MDTLIAPHREALERICVRHRVRRLELFGSATGDRFREESDLDFLVEFQELQPGEYAEHYFGLLEDLQELFGRAIDLVMLSAVHNPYFLEDIAASRQVLYAA